MNIILMNIVRELQPQDIQIPHLCSRTFADVAKAQNNKGALTNQCYHNSS